MFVQVDDYPPIEEPKYPRPEQPEEPREEEQPPKEEPNNHERDDDRYEEDIQFKDIPFNTTVGKRSPIQLNFNSSLDMSTVNEETFKVYDSMGNAVPINFAQANKGKTIYIQPQGEYTNGETYTLYVYGEQLKSTKGKKVSSSLRIEFLSQY